MSVDIRESLKTAILEFQNAVMILYRDFGVSINVTKKQAKMVIETEPDKSKAQKFANYITSRDNLDKTVNESGLDIEVVRKLIDRDRHVEPSLVYIDFDLKQRMPELFEAEKESIQSWENHKHLESQVIDFAKRWRCLFLGLNLIYGADVILNTSLDELKKKEIDPQKIDKLNEGLNITLELEEMLEDLTQQGVELSLIHHILDQYL